MKIDEEALKELFDFMDSNKYHAKQVMQNTKTLEKIIGKPFNEMIISEDNLKDILNKLHKIIERKI